MCALSSALILDSLPEHKEYTDFLMTNKGYYESVFGDLDKVKGSHMDYSPWQKKWPPAGKTQVLHGLAARKTA